MSATVVISTLSLLVLLFVAYTDVKVKNDRKRYEEAQDRRLVKLQSSFQTVFDELVHSYGWDSESSPFREVQEAIDDFVIDPANPLGV